jgi:hypothetical protein
MHVHVHACVPFFGRVSSPAECRGKYNVSRSSQAVVILRGFEAGFYSWISKQGREAGF